MSNATIPLMAFSNAGKACIWAAFGLVMCLALVGNGVVIWIIVAHAKMRSITNFFLLNLSLSDLLLTILQVVPNVSYALESSWNFGLFYCRVSNFMTTFSISLSVFTFMAIAIERYVVIVYPLRPRPKRTVIIGSIMFIWAFSILTATPPAMFSLTAVEAGNFTSCKLQSDIVDVYDYVLLMLQCLIPLGVVGSIYVIIGVRLWKQGPIGEQTAGQGDSMKAKRKIVRMMVIVVVIFALCWIPYQLVFLLSFSSVELFIILYFVAVCSTVPNPFIYCKMNRNFRLGFCQAFRCLPFVTVDRERYAVLKFGHSKLRVVSHSLAGRLHHSQAQTPALLQDRQTCVTGAISENAAT